MTDEDMARVIAMVVNEFDPINEKCTKALFYTNRSQKREKVRETDDLLAEAIKNGAFNY